MNKNSSLYLMGNGALGDLARLRECKRGRVSSYDKSGGNKDYWTIKPGTKSTIANIKGPACIRHIWVTIGSNEPFYPRKILLRMYWDQEPQPSVEVPIGDFFGLGHGLIKNFTSLPLTMSPGAGKGFNCFFPMPFAKSGRLEIENQGQEEIAFFFYIDYEQFGAFPEDLAYFHTQWRRANPTPGWTPKPEQNVWAEPNLKGEKNYVILEAQGRGHYVGCNLNIDCFGPRWNSWYGEGDDMIFIDDDETPTLYGTGTEDYFNTAYCPNEEFSAPYHGIPLCSHPKWDGKNSLYRFHIEDPIHFYKSIKVTIEHGHANNLSNDYSSTAYWYQLEPHKHLVGMLPVTERLPRADYRQED